MKLSDLKENDTVVWHRGKARQPILCTVRRRVGTLVAVGVKVRRTLGVTEVEKLVAPKRLTKVEISEPAA